MRPSMKSTLICIALMSGITYGKQAVAGDLPGARRQQAVNYSQPMLASNWAGVYAGLHLGYGFGRARSADIDGFLGGVHGGVNFQSGQIVYGGELDLTYGRVDYRGFADTFQQKWLASARGRVGYAFDRFMPFVTAGLAYTNATMKAGGGKDSHGHIGYVLGIGGEMMLTDKVSANLQLLHYRFDSETYRVLPAARNSNVVTNELRIGVNYRF